MDGNKYYWEGKKRVNLIVNLVLSFICFAGCIVALVINGGYNSGFETFIVFDLIAIVIAVIAMFSPGKAAMWCYMVGAASSFIAFCIIIAEDEIGALVIQLPIYQGICIVLTHFMRVTITLEDGFLSAAGEKSKTLIPYESIDYIKTGIFSMVDFRSSAGRISCVFVQDANLLYRSVAENRKNRLASYTTGLDNYTQSSVIDELPEL